ncbi:hypothetical protein ACWEFJ_31390 [Actinosynnema sp. NPDC004786]
MSDEVPLPGQAHNSGVRNSLSDVTGAVVRAGRTGPVTINVRPAGVDQAGTAGPGTRHPSFGLAVAAPAITPSPAAVVGFDHSGSGMAVAGSARSEAPTLRPRPTSGTASAPSPGTDRLTVEVATRNDRFPDLDRVEDDGPDWTEDSGAGDLSPIDNGIFDLYATGGAALSADREKEPPRMRRSTRRKRPPGCERDFRRARVILPPHLGRSDLGGRIRIARPPRRTTAGVTRDVDRRRVE